MASNTCLIMSNAVMCDILSDIALRKGMNSMPFGSFKLLKMGLNRIIPHPLLNKRKDTGRQPQTLFSLANSSAVSRRIITKSGTDNLSGSESVVAKSEFQNSNVLPWKSGNADFEAHFGQKGP